MADPFQDVEAPHHDCPANVMAVDCTGQNAVLAARKGLGFVSLDNPFVIAKRVARNSKWETGAIEWNPHISHSHIFAATANQKAEIWNWRDSTGVQQQILRAHTRVISDLNWSWFDQQLLATCSVDHFIYMWDLRDSRKPATSLQAVAGASQVKWNRVNRHVLATSHDGDVRIWDLRKGNTPVTYITAHLSKIHGLDWSRSSGTVLATCSNDATVKLWNTDSPRQPDSVLNTMFPVWRARFTPFGEGLVTVVLPQLRRGENSLLLWNCMDLSQPVHTFVGHSDVVLEFQWRSRVIEDEEQFQLITWSKDCTLRFWALDPRVVNACGGNLQESSSQDLIGGSSGKPSDMMNEAHASGNEEVFPDGSVSFSLQPQTLQQEFALINMNIPNVTVEQMNAGTRCCTVKVSSGFHIVTVVINFPSHYPTGNATPSFEFTADSSIDMATKSKLIKTLQETAQSHVRLNQACLEPCLRQLVTHLDTLTLQEDSTMVSSVLSPLHRRLDTVSYGSYQDAAIPFPRHSGGRFCACGLLVSFTHPGRFSGMTGSSVEQTPRSLSALSAYSTRPSGGPALPPLVGGSKSGMQKTRTFTSFEKQVTGTGKRIFYRSLSQSEGVRFENKYNDVPSRNSRVSQVVIRDVTALMPLHYSLAQGYTLEGDVLEICKKNGSVATSVGRRDLVQTWSLLSQVLDRKLADTTNMDESPWALHPFGRALVQSLMEYYLSIRDIQTLGMLACVLTHNTLPDSFKPPKSHLGHNGSSKSFTYGVTQPSFDTSVHQSAKRSKSVSCNEDQSPPEVGQSWGEISFPLEGWTQTPPIFIQRKDPAEEQKKIHEKNCRIVETSKLPQYDHFKKVYADILYRWNLLNKRAEVLKYLSKPAEPHKGVEFSTRCQHCGQKMRGTQCYHCKWFGFQCVICHVAVKGASNFCVACGHGGHAYHIMKWFETMDVCPTGCGCRCLKDGTFLVD